MTRLFEDAFQAQRIGALALFQNLVRHDMEAVL